MVEYILGIGSLSDKECQEVFSEVSKRKEGLIAAQATITKEVNVLNAIQFQVAHRRTEIQKKKNYCSKCNSPLYWNTKDDTWYCENPVCPDSEELFKEKNS